MALVISDSSTLIHLTAIDRLHLLRAFYVKITIPPAVWNEVVEQGKGRAGAAEVREACRSGWVETAMPGDSPFLHLLKRDLSEGEAEVIALAVERGADLVLLDESEARGVARMYGLRKTGAIGILIRAKREGKIESLRTELDRLQDESGFWIDRALYRQALRAVGEGD